MMFKLSSLHGQAFNFERQLIILVHFYPFIVNSYLLDCMACSLSVKIKSVSHIDFMYL
jgi:hypothetical protein